MGESFYLVNLTDRVHTGRQGKLGEIIYDIGGRIITLLRGWNNPFQTSLSRLDSSRKRVLRPGLRLKITRRTALF